MPSPCFNGSPNVYPAPTIIWTFLNVSQTFLWRKVLPSRMGINLRIYLWPYKCNHQQQQLRPIIPLCSSLIHGTSTTISSHHLPFQNRMRPHGGHSNQPKRNGRHLYQWFHWPYSQHQGHIQCYETGKSFSPWDQRGSLRSLQIQTPSSRWHGCMSKANIGNGSIRIKDHSWMDARFLSNDYHTTRKQNRSLLENNIQLQLGWNLSRELEVNIGRWVHLGQIDPTVQQFLSRLCFLKQHAETRRSIDINEQCQAELSAVCFSTIFKMASTWICIPTSNSHL